MLEEATSSDIVILLVKLRPKGLLLLGELLLVPAELLLANRECLNPGEIAGEEFVEDEVGEIGEVGSCREVGEGGGGGG